MLVCWLFDLRSRYGYHGSLLLGLHWETVALGEGETTVTTRTRNIRLTRLPHVAFMSFRQALIWWVFMGGWENLCVAQQRNEILVGLRKPSPSCSFSQLWRQLWKTRRMLLAQSLIIVLLFIQPNLLMQTQLYLTLVLLKIIPLLRLRNKKKVHGQIVMKNSLQL